MAPRRNMKIPLHLVPLQAPINPTRIRTHPPPQLRRLHKQLPLPRPPRRRQIVMHILDILARQPGLHHLLPPPVVILLAPTPHRLIQPMHILAAAPLIPHRPVLRQRIARQDPVPGRILDVDVQIRALHRDHDVEVQLQRSRDAGLDGKGVRCRAREPAGGLGDCQVDGR